MAIHLPNGSLKTRSWLEPVPTSPLSDDIATSPSEVSLLLELELGWRERNVLFYDALNTFYLRLYGVRYMVKDHSDSEKGNPLPPHRLLLSINTKGSFICTIPHMIAHTTAFVTPVVEHWLEREIAQWVHPMKDRSDDPSHHERRLLPRSYVPLPMWSIIYVLTINSLYLNLCSSIQDYHTNGYWGGGNLKLQVGGSTLNLFSYYPGG